MNDKTNGSGRSHKDKNEDKVLSFPTLAERDRLRREQIAQGAPAKVPFINTGNILPFTRVMIIAFLAVHIPVHLIFDSGAKLQAFYTMGFVPGYFTGAAGGMPWFAPLGLVAHMFIHGSWMHLAFNIVMGLALGLFFEREFGTRSATLFFFACGAAGAALYFILNPFSTVPVIGASGGISGFFGAAILLLNQRGLLGRMGRRGPWPLIIFWTVFMIVGGLLSGGTMAWQAHVGGFLTGVLIVRLHQKGKIRL